jgi:hypothetical protein
VEKMMNATQVAALFCVIPLISLLAPVVKDKTASLIALPNVLSAYEGDGILTADTSSNLYVWWWWPSIYDTMDTNATPRVW